MASCTDRWRLARVGRACIVFERYSYVTGAALTGDGGWSVH